MTSFADKMYYVIVSNARQPSNFNPIKTKNNKNMSKIDFYVFKPVHNMFDTNVGNKYLCSIIYALVMVFLKFYTVS